jgi:Protein of unknown function (DUF805).
MDLKVLNILFNYKGTISAREFRVGLVVIFMTLGAYFTLIIQSPIDSILKNIFDRSIEGNYFILNNIFINFVPKLIPIKFILCYCSIVLCIKRMRSFSSNRAIISLSGLSNYLFFCLFLSLNNLTTEFSRYLEKSSIIIISIIFGIIFLAGIINIIYLIREKENEECYIEQYDRKLNIEGFALKIGNLMIYIFAISLIWLSLNYLFIRKSYNTQIIIYIIDLILNLIYLIFYLQFISRRLRDAGKSQVWIAAIFGAYFFFLAINLIVSFHFSNYFIYSSIIFAMVANLFIASQFILFLLPSKEESTSPTPPKEGLAQSDEKF